MIYGPYSTGWRDETARQVARRRAAWVLAGLVLVLGLAGSLML